MKSPWTAVKYHPTPHAPRKGGTTPSLWITTMNNLFNVYRSPSVGSNRLAQCLPFSTALLLCKAEADKARAEKNGSLIANPNGHGWVVRTPSHWEDRPNCVLFTLHQSGERMFSWEIEQEVARLGGEVVIKHDDYVGDLHIFDDEGNLLLTGDRDKLDTFDTDDVVEFVFNLFQ